MASVAFEAVSKVFGDGTRAVDRLDLEIADGEFMVLVGPSGCGKTTALRMVAGLEDISDGVVRIGERRRQRPLAEEPRHRDGLPELRALPAPDASYDNIAFAAEDQEDAEGRDPAPRRRGRADPRPRAAT